MSYPVELRTDRPAPNCVVLTVLGEIDLVTVPGLESAIAQHVAAAPCLVIDLSGVTFFGSAGVTALVWLSRHGEAQGKHVRVVATSRIVTGPLELTGLLDRLDVQGMPDGPRPTPGSALQS